MATRIRQFAWSRDGIDCIDGCGVTPRGVEEACFGYPLVQHAKSGGETPLYCVLGQTDAGQYLFRVDILFSDGQGYSITARRMMGKKERKETIPPMEKPTSGRRPPDRG